jgi:succinyl-CoA synthetase beta subunit
MNLLEYEAKDLLRHYSVPVPAGQQFTDPQAFTPSNYPLVLKVQIPKGGRGKAGGIVTVHDYVEYAKTAERLLKDPILGCQVSSLLAEEVLDHERELYLAITVDRKSATVMLLAHRNGGVEIEQTVAAPGSEPMLRVVLVGIPDDNVVQELQAYYDLPDSALPLLQKLLVGLYEAFIQEDALLIEINPLMVLTGGELVCADAKIELDDAAAFRHTERKLETQAVSSQFVELNSLGTVASMANGAGLAMATVDAIKAAGAIPANFYDVGGGTNVQGMVQAFAKIAAMPNVSSIVVNIFGGITRCDEVAEAIIEAKKVCANLPQLYIRLTGTNEAQGKKLLEAAGIPFYQTLAACVAEAVK